jgi:hypothetical protein
MGSSQVASKEIMVRNDLGIRPHRGPTPGSAPTKDGKCLFASDLILVPPTTYLSRQ